ncbi:nuclear transport factor 2 family protein [Pararoseomonas indoligenes]|uniref:Nuclear transport factor 2 family protein n=1 Tax=Roseomonas indoligenes TaxID=2820811 RepID=A0A940N4H8_9PROT|nr:nuclear transport factor 2 family protein [Pararoseomonas indoligenes]MBP0494047.1 nuclear transport factor 2 family protein [Pararoseomonas indoligenes]
MEQDSGTAALMRRNLHGVFGERDAARRRAAIAELYAEDLVFADPHGSGRGQAALDESVQALQAKLPDFVFTETGPVQAVEGAGRLHWGFGPPGGPPRVTGLDVAVVRGGRIAALYTFLDPPAG